MGWAGSLGMRQSVAEIRRPEFECHLAMGRIEGNNVLRFSVQHGCWDSGCWKLPLIAHYPATTFPGVAVLDADEAEVRVFVALIRVTHSGDHRSEPGVPKRHGDKLSRYGAIGLVNSRTIIGPKIRRQLRASAARKQDKSYEKCRVVFHSTKQTPQTRRFVYLAAHADAQRLPSAVRASRQGRSICD